VSLEALVYSLIERYHRNKLGGAVHHERHAIVTSYDPDKYLAKVMFMPGGQVSGWLPIETGHIGEQYGVAVGLQPGDGKNQGDQVIVRYQEGDLESGKIVQRVHSDNEKPPKVQSGEMVLWTRFRKSDGGPNSAQGAQGGTGQQIYFKNDGSLTITDGNGFTLTADGQGNATLTCKNYTINASGNISVSASGSISSSAASRSDSYKGSWAANAASSVWAWLTSGNDLDSD
jgi:uncharacterized protein involved in type VI secretion and phage assembly